MIGCLEINMISLGPVATIPQKRSPLVNKSVIDGRIPAGRQAGCILAKMKTSMISSVFRIYDQTS
jgi:hypothetical protein